MEPIGTTVLAIGVVVLSATVWGTRMGNIPQRLLALSCGLLLFAGLTLSMDALGLEPAWLYGALTTTLLGVYPSFRLLSRQRRVLPGRAGFVTCSAPTDIIRHLPSFIVGREGTVRDIHGSLLRFVGGAGSTDREGSAPHLPITGKGGESLDPAGIPEDRWERARLGGEEDGHSVLLRAIPLGDGGRRVFCVIPPAADETSPSPVKDLFDFGQAVHDLRSPVTAIVGFAEMLRDEIADPDADQLDYVETIIRNGNHLMDLVDSNLARVASATEPPARGPVDLAALLQAQVADFQPLARKLDTTIVLGECDFPFMLDLPGLSLKRVLQNLIGNALKYGAGGEVTIRAEWETQGDSGRLSIDVIDTGSGIPEEGLKEIFRPYVQLDRSDSPGGGIGLGLSIVRRLVDEMGGEIRVVSELDLGSTFSIYLPAPVAGDRPGLQEPSDDDCGQGINRVLVADEAVEVRAQIKAVLAGLGLQVEEAADGAAALSLFQKVRFDLVLLGLEMTGLSGVETAKLLRDVGFTGPVVALTDDDSPRTADLCRQAGFSDRLTKPLAQDSLTALVERRPVLLAQA